MIALDRIREYRNDVVSAGIFTFNGTLSGYATNRGGQGGSQEDVDRMVNFCATALSVVRSLAKSYLSLVSHAARSGGIRAETLIWVAGSFTIGMKPIDSTQGVFVVMTDASQLGKLDQVIRDIMYNV